MIFKRTEGISTTDIVGRLLLMSSSSPKQNLYKPLKFSKDGGVLAS